MAATSQEYDTVVLGATPGGIAAAVRAAREGLACQLVTFNAHVGGMMAGGLSVTDTTLSPTRARTPLLDEFFERVREHYREAYGPDSEQVENCNDGMFFEPKVAEAVFEDLLEEAGVEVRREYYPVDATRSEGTLRRVTFASMDDEDNRFEAAAGTFVDGTYEGDLAAVAGVPYRVGREGRAEFGEQYAGRLFSEKGTRIYPGSTGVGDDVVQSYDYRLCLSRDPDNRRRPEKPEEYDRAEFLPMMEDGPEAEFGHGKSYRSQEMPCHIKSELVRPTVEEIREMGLASYLLLRGPLPNDKRDLNTADLPGEVDDYPEADWDRRREIATRHEEHVLGMLYFLQNDEAVPEDLREEAREWGLPEDEFEDNDGFPFQLYVREGRRIEGRETFTEHDARLAEGIERSPINEDSIAVAEYAMDSHDCRPVRRPGSLAEGHHYLGEITVPSQVPYGALLPEGLDNLLVPVPLSATHVGFGTIRLEPTWLQIGESAGYAAALAAADGTTPGALDADDLQRTLAEAGSMVTFFDDVYLDEDVRGTAAAQYLGAKGFFRGYEARLSADLDEETADRWARLAAAEAESESETEFESEAETDATGATRSATDRARSLPEAPGGWKSVALDDFAQSLREAFERRELDPMPVDDAVGRVDADGDGDFDRGVACDVVYDLLA
jgi:hypothetical protein